MKLRDLRDCLIVGALFALLFLLGRYDAEQEIRAECYKQTRDTDCFALPIVNGEVSFPK